MSDDVEQRLALLEQREAQERAAWLREAAEQRGWHAPGDAAKMVDTASVTSRTDAAKAVARFEADRPYVRRDYVDPSRPMSEDAYRRRLGEQLLEAMDRDLGRRRG
jgi:hypothetical protein